MNIKLKIKKLHTDAKVPEYATKGSACFDLHALSNSYNSKSSILRTGLSFEIPSGYVMLVFSRSGHGFKNDTRLANCVGVIDSDYRGEVMVKLTRDIDERGEGVLVKSKDRIAQAMIVEIPRIDFVVEEELSSTERGHHGFGSTGN